MMLYNKNVIYMVIKIALKLLGNFVMYLTSQFCVKENVVSY
jgi:hypothetical protein